MDLVLEFLNQPIVLTLVSLAVGSYLLSVIAERRSRRDKLKDEAIEFLTEAGRSINEFLPHIYAHLRTGHIRVDPAVDKGLKDLFASSMGIRIGSQVYLRSNDFHKRYAVLLNELAAVVSCIAELEGERDSPEAALRIQENRSQLRDSWPLADESLRASDGRLVDELILWMDMIVSRTVDLLTSNLKSVMR